MERLTNSIDYCKLHCDFGLLNECFFQNKSKCYENNIYEKLREYEDLEEQGLLLRLPCKVGDTVYRITPNDNYIMKSTVEEFVSFVSTNSIYMIVRDELFNCRRGLPNSEIGKTWFLTREEAEQKLKEMESDRYGTEILC